MHKLPRLSFFRLKQAIVVIAQITTFLWLAPTAWGVCDLQPSTPALDTSTVFVVGLPVTCTDADSTLTLSRGFINANIYMAGGNDTFRWVDSYIAKGAVIDGGTGTDTVTLTTVVDLAFSGSSFSNFEKLIKLNNTIASQSDNLNLGAKGTLDIEAGSYSLLGTITATALALEGSGKLLINDGSTITGDITGDGAGQDIIFYGGTLPASIKLRGGADKFTLSGGTLSTSVNLGPSADQFIFASGELSGTVSLASSKDTFTFQSGLLSGIAHLGPRDDSFNWTGDGTVTSGSLIDGANDIDTLNLMSSSDLSFGGANFKNFEILTKSSSNTVVQSGSLNLGGTGSITISAGTYMIDSGGELLGNSLAVSGGILTGEGMVQLSDAISSFMLSGGSVATVVDLGGGTDTFTFSDGSIASGGEVRGGSESDEIAFTGTDDVTVAGSSVTGFEVLTKSGSGKVTQSGSLNLGGSGSITISVGTYMIDSGGELLGNSLAVSGGSLAGPGMVQLSDAISSFMLSGGSVATVVDLGGGADTFTFSGGSIASGGEVRGGSERDEIAFTGTDDVTVAGSSVTGFEVLTKSGSGKVTQSGSLSLGGSGSITISVGTYMIESGGELLGQSLAVSGGSLVGPGMVQLGTADGGLSLSDGSVATVVDLGGGADTFTFSGGSIASGGEVRGGSERDEIAFTGTDDVTVAGSSVTGFEVLTKSGSGKVTQSGSLSLGGSGSITISVGTYMIESGGELLGQSLAVSGGSLAGPGMVQLGTADGGLSLSDGSVATRGGFRGRC